MNHFIASIRSVGTQSSRIFAPEDYFSPKYTPQIPKGDQMYYCEAMNLANSLYVLYVSHCTDILFRLDNVCSIYCMSFEHIMYSIRLIMLLTFLPGLLFVSVLSTSIIAAIGGRDLAC